MIATKIINNNAAYSKDELGRDVIVVGKGVGFQKKSGQELDRSKIEKIFRFTPERTSQFAELVSSMPFEHVRLAEKIIVYAGSQLGKHLSRNIYITLTDHLNFALERYRKGIEIRNELLWEIQHYYHDEYMIGLKALDMVQDETGIRLPDEEAGFFALHIVNAEVDGDMTKTSTAPAVIKGSLKIVQLFFNIILDEDSLAYERFVTHMKFLIQRALRNKPYGEPDSISLSLWEELKQEHQKAYLCAQRVQAYISSSIQSIGTEEELIYLTIHIARVVSCSQEGG